MSFLGNLLNDRDNWNMQLKQRMKRKKAALEYMEAIPYRKVGLFCEIRWVELFTTLDNFQTLHICLVDCLDTVAHCGEYDTKSTTEAHGLLGSITPGKFLVSYYTRRYVSGFLVALGKFL